MIWSHEEVDSTKHLVQSQPWRLAVAVLAAAEMERQQLVSIFAVVLIEVNGVALDVYLKVELVHGFSFFCLQI